MKEKLIKETFELLGEILNRNIGHALEYEWYVDVDKLTMCECDLLHRELTYNFYKNLVDELCDYLNHEDAKCII